MEQDIFLDMFFAFFFAVSENLFTFAAIKGSHWRVTAGTGYFVTLFLIPAHFTEKFAGILLSINNAKWLTTRKTLIKTT